MEDIILKENTPNPSDYRLGVKSRIFFRYLTKYFEESENLKKFEEWKKKREVEECQLKNCIEKEPLLHLENS